MIFSCEVTDLKYFSFDMSQRTERLYVLVR